METSIPISSNLLFSIIAALIIAIVSILVIIIKQMRTESKTEFQSLKSEIKYLNECEKKNYTVRHNFDTVTQGIMNHVDEKFQSMKELVENKIDNINTRFDDVIDLIKKKK